MNMKQNLTGKLTNESTLKKQYSTNDAAIFKSQLPSAQQI